MLSFHLVFIGRDWKIMIDEKNREKRVRMQVILGLGAVVVMMGIAVFLSQLISDVRGQIAEQYIKLDQSMSNVSFDVVLEEEVSKWSDELDRIKMLVIYRDEIGQIIGELEREAKKHKVELRVPSVKEEVKINEEGETMEASGLWREVRLSLVVIGAPENLSRFLHAIEHKPYLMAVVSWQLEVQAPIISRSVAALMPSRVMSGAPEGQEVLVKSNSSMKVDVVLTTLDNKDL